MKALRLNNPCRPWPVAEDQSAVGSRQSAVRSGPEVRLRISDFGLRASRGGFTLIEMLVVITIMVLLMGAALKMLPATKARRSREAARALNVYLSSARNRAMETGRPCGVILHRFGSLACAMTADQCEVPPCFCGESENAAAVLQTKLVMQGAGTVTVLVATFVENGTPTQLPAGTVKPGDFIQFNSQGNIYTIAPTSGTENTVDGNGYITNCSALTMTTLGVGQNPLVPWPSTPKKSQPVPYRIFRAPTKAVASSLQLPAGAVVDLSASGTLSQLFGSADVTILFDSNGAVNQVYSAGLSGSVIEPIFLLVGKRERVGNTAQNPQTTANQSQWANWQDLDNLWVVINPQTGLITTSDIATGASIGAARAHARDVQGMGGK